MKSIVEAPLPRNPIVRACIERASELELFGLNYATVAKSPSLLVAVMATFGRKAVDRSPVYSAEQAATAFAFAAAFCEAPE